MRQIGSFNLYGPPAKAVWLLLANLHVAPISAASPKAEASWLTNFWAGPQRGTSTALNCTTPQVPP